jgi:hypothetical protein
MEPLGWDEIVSQPGMGGYLSFLNGPVPLPHLQGADSGKAPVVESTAGAESTPISNSSAGVGAATEGSNVSIPGVVTLTGADLATDPTAAPVALVDSAPGSPAHTVMVSGTAPDTEPGVAEMSGESTSGSVTPTVEAPGTGNDTKPAVGSPATPGAETAAEPCLGTEPDIDAVNVTTPGAVSPSGPEKEMDIRAPGVDSPFGGGRDLVDTATGHETSPGVDMTSEGIQNRNRSLNVWVHTAPGAGTRTGPFRTPHGLRIRKCFAAQDGHSLGEEVLYQSLWKTAAPEQGGARTIVIGWRGMAQICRMTPKNCKINTQRLIRKLALEVLSPYNTPESIGTTYRVYSPEDIFERRRAAGLEWVVRSKGVEFVDPTTGLAHSAHLGDYASD